MSDGILCILTYTFVKHTRTHTLYHNFKLGQGNDISFISSVFNVKQICISFQLSPHQQLQA